MMRHPQLLLIPPAVAGIGLLLPHLASAYTSPHVTTRSKDGDWFYNYDFNSKSVSQSNVDVAMTMLWDCNAEIDAIKDNIFDGSGGLSGWHRVSLASKYARLYENSNSTKPEWDADSGVQTDDCEYVSGQCENFNWNHRQMHTRLYAPTDSPYYDQMYNTTWAYYIVASTHYDYNHAACSTPCSAPEQFGWPENVEDRIVGLVHPLEHAEFQDESVSFYNNESGFWWPSGGNHFHNASGYASRVCYK